MLHSGTTCIAAAGGIHGAAVGSSPPGWQVLTHRTPAPVCLPPHARVDLRRHPRRPGTQAVHGGRRQATRACSFSVIKATSNVDRSGVIGGSAYCVGSDLSLAIRFFESLSIDCPRNCTHHHSPHHPTAACPTRRQSAPTQTYRLSQAPQLAPTQKPPAPFQPFLRYPCAEIIKTLIAIIGTLLSRLSVA